MLSSGGELVNSMMIGSRSFNDIHRLSACHTYTEVATLTSLRSLYKEAPLLILYHSKNLIKKVKKCQEEAKEVKDLEKVVPSVTEKSFVIISYSVFKPGGHMTILTRTQFTRSFCS